MDAPATIGVIGLGAMGAGVARSLRRGGFSVLGYDVRPEAAAALADAGVAAAKDPAEIGRKAKIAVILVMNLAQTRDALFGASGLATTMAPGGVIISSSTMAPDDAEALANDIVAKGLLMIDAPVSGGAKGAAEGALTVMASGPDAAFQTCAAVFTAIARKLYRIGAAPGQGSRVKMINQILAGVHIVAAMEAFAFGIRAGCDPQILFDVISHSAGNSSMVETRVPRVLAGDDRPLSMVDIFIKDFGIIMDAARSLRFPLPLAAAAQQQFMAAAAAGHGRADDTSVIKVYQALSGIALPKKTAAE